MRSVAQYMLDVDQGLTKPMTPPKLPKTLLEAARSGRLIPFVGAGVSMAVRRTDGARAFPSWVELLDASAKRLDDEHHPEYAEAIRALLRLPKPDLFDVAKRARDALGSATWRRFLVEQFDPSQSEIDDESLALARAIWGVGSKLVITTNYDRVLSWACPQPGNLRHWRFQSEGDFVDLLGGRLARPSLWQLHGSIDEPNQLILTPDGYRELYGDDSQKPRHQAALTSLHNLIAGHHLLFVGFSLDDEYVTRQFDWVHETFRGCAGPHYVLVRAAEFARTREKLEGTAIQAIPFEDFGGPLVRLLQQIRDAPVGVDAPDQPARPPIDAPQPTVAGSAEPNEENDSGPLVFLLDLVIELLVILVVMGGTLLKAFAAMIGLFIVFGMNLWIGIHAWASLFTANFWPSELVYAIISVVLILPLSMHHYMLKIYPDLRREEGALSASAHFLITFAGAILAPIFVTGRAGLRTRVPRGIFGYTEVVLLSGVFLYWGHVMWWSIDGSPLPESPLFAAATYLSPVSLFFVGLWWARLENWMEFSIFHAAENGQELARDSSQLESPSASDNPTGECEKELGR